MQRFSSHRLGRPPDFQAFPILTMFGALILAAASFLTSPVEEIVLKSGAVIAVEDLVRVERGRLIYEDAEGVLYSIRLRDVDVEATDARLPANREDVETGLDQTDAGPSALPKKLPVSEEEKTRILEEMESRSHTGRAIEEEEAPLPSPAPGTPSGGEDEWKWREASRRHDEAVERAKQRLAEAKQRERELNALVLYFAGSSGDASNYSYLVYQLQDLRSMIPRLESDVRRAEAARRQFRDDARRQGILPGWLR